MKPETEEIVNAIFERLGKELVRLSRTILTTALVAMALVVAWRAQPSGFLESLIYMFLTLALVSPLLLVLFEKLPQTWRAWVGWPLFFLWCYISGDAVSPKELRPLALLAVALLGLLTVLSLWGGRHLWQVSGRQRARTNELVHRFNNKLKKAEPTLKLMALAAAIGVVVPLIIARGNIGGQRSTLLEGLVMWGELPGNFHAPQITLLVVSMFLVAIVTFASLARGKAVWARRDRGGVPKSTALDKKLKGNP